MAENSRQERPLPRWGVLPIQATSWRWTRSDSWQCDKEEETKAKASRGHALQCLDHSFSQCIAAQSYSKPYSEDEQGGAVCATQRCRLFFASSAASWCFFTADWSSIRDVLQLQEQLKYFHCQSKLDPPHSPKVGDWTSFGLHFLFHRWSALSRPFSRTSFYQRPDERHDSFYR